MSGRHVVTACVAAAALTAAAQTAAATTYKQIGSASASGDYAIALAAGEAKHPRGVYVAVLAGPRQPVDVNWTMVCGKGFGAGSKSGDYTTSSSAKRKLKLPMSNPDSCSVSAGGSLARGGHVRVRLYQR